MYAKNFHVSNMDLRICANNPLLEDFVIHNHYAEFLPMYTKTSTVSNLGFAYMRKQSIVGRLCYPK